jgi:hypothetical protein
VDLIGKSGVSFILKELSRSSEVSDCVRLGLKLGVQVEVVGLDMTELSGDLLIRLGHVGEVVGEAVVDIFQVDALGLEVAVGDVDVVVFDSETVELGGEVGDGVIKVGALVGEGVVGLLEIGTLGLAGGEEVL